MAEGYLKYDWGRSEQWQIYMSNLFGIKSREDLERVRRKWYVRNVDKNFDINFN